MTLREFRALIVYRLGIARYLFIHIPKNAGVSIRKAPALKNRLIAADPSFHINKQYTAELTRVMAERGEHHGHQHARWRDIRKDVREKLQAVAIVRNPWARTVSRYRFALTAIETGKAGKDYVAGSFDEFLEERHRYGHLPYYWHRAIRGWYPQADHVTDESGVIRADILRFEDLESESTRYFNLAAPPPRRNISTAMKSDYRSFYTPRTIQIVADWYAQDIEMFGFDFDSAATCNTVYDGASCAK